MSNQPAALLSELSAPKCERKGRVRLSGLVAQYGADYPMTQLRRDLAGDCPRLRPGVRLMDLCDAHFPELPGIMQVKSATSPP